ncbi:hypothetical protein CYMTET_23471, partial [Cymbomonas tetramitiformis]
MATLELFDPPAKMSVSGGYPGEKSSQSALLEATLWNPAKEPDAEGWVLVGNMRARRSDLTALLHGQNVYVFGGCDTGNDVHSVERLDVSTGTWHQVAGMSTVRSGCGSAALGQHLYVVGGYDGKAFLRSAERLRVATGCWEPVGNMSSPRHGCAVVAHGQHVYAVGGYDRERGDFLKTAERLDVSTGRWEPAGVMLSRRQMCSTAAHGQHLYAIGGFDGKNFLRSAERFDGETARWKPVGNMTTPRVTSQAVVHGLYVYVIGGYDGQEYIQAVERLDVSTGRFEPAGRLRTRRSGSTAVAHGEHIYVVGGRDATSWLGSVERLHVPSGRWEMAASMNTCRSESAVLSHAQHLYVLGGCDGFQKHCSVERLDTVHGTLEAEEGGSGGGLGGEYLYVLGGCDGRSWLETAERLDVRTGRWEAVAPMAQRRFAGAAVVHGAHVYALGGFLVRSEQPTVERLHVTVVGGAERWETVGRLSSCRQGCAVVVHGRYIYTIGGSESGSWLRTAERMDVATGQWEPVADMGVPRSGCAAVAHGNHVYVIGGYDRVNYVNTVERLDVEAGRWEPVGCMSARRFGCAAAIHGRHIYVLGGCDWSSRLRTVERMDLISGKWEPVEDMSTPRGGCAAVATGPYIYAIGGSDGMHRLHSVERLDVRFGWWEPVADMGTRRDGCAAAVVAGCFPVDTPAQSPLPLTAHSLEGGEAIAPAPDALPTASQWQAARAADMRITGAGGLVTLDLLHRAVQAMRRQLDSKPALPAKLRALVCLLRDYAEAAGEEEAKQEGEVEREQEVEPPEGVVLRARWADAWLCRDRWQAAQREVRRAVAEVQGMEEQGEIRAGTRGPPAVLQQTIDARDEARGAYLSTLRGGLEEREALGPSVSARLEELQELVATWRSALQGEGMAGAIVDMPDAKHPKRDPRVAAANYDEWEKNRRGHRLARTTESALAALRGALHACFASDEPEDKEGDPAATRTTPEASPAELGRCTEEAHNAMRAELSFLEAPRDGEDELPDVGELREAGAVVLTGCLREEAEAKRTAEEIRMLGRELQELQGAAGSAAQEGVEDAVKRLQGAGQAVARLRRQLKRRLLDQEELAEAAAAAEAGESARAAELAEAARGEVAEVRRQLRSEQCTANTAMCALAAVERHFPEVMWHMQSGVPAELLPLWR